MKKTPEYDKLDVYFNDDGARASSAPYPRWATPQIAAIFQSWIEPIKDHGIESVTGVTSGPTVSPVAQTPPASRGSASTASASCRTRLEYGTRTHHSNMDLYDRVQKGDVMQGSMIEAWFAYNAATRPDMLPRIETPAPSTK